MDGYRDRPLVVSASGVRLAVPVRLSHARHPHRLALPAVQPVTTDPLIRPEGVYVGATEGATRYRPEEASMTDPTPAHALDANHDGKPDYSSEGWALLGPLAPYAKALIAFLAPGLLVLAVPLTAGRVPTLAECLTALGTALATALAVYAVPNRPRTTTP